jgi:biotin carboxyl carrier protein
MKMEHTLIATRDGVVERVLTEAGVGVESGHRCAGQAEL